MSIPSAPLDGEAAMVSAGVPDSAMEGTGSGSAVSAVCAVPSAVEELDVLDVPEASDVAAREPSDEDAPFMLHAVEDNITAAAVSAAMVFVSFIVCSSFQGQAAVDSAEEVCSGAELSAVEAVVEAASAVSASLISSLV